MLGWKLVNIEYGSRVIEAEYVDNRLSGFIARTKKNDNVSELRVSQRVAHFLRRFAGVIDGRNEDVAIRVCVAQLSDSFDVRSNSNQDVERPAIDSASCVSTGDGSNPLAFDFHVSLDMFRSAVDPERTTTLYFSVESNTSRA